MAKLGRRERLEKRTRLASEKQLQLVRKEQVRAESKFASSMPKREMALLSGTQAPRHSLSSVNLKSMTHYAGAYVGRSPGTKPKERKPMPDRFKTAFMASGHEALITEVQVTLPMVKVGRARKTGKPKWRIVGKADSIPG